MRNTALRRASSFFFAIFFVTTLSAMQAPPGQTMTLADAVEATVQFFDKADCCDGPIETCVHLLEEEQAHQRIGKYLEPCNNEKVILCCCTLLCCGSCINCPQATACCCGITGGCLYVLYRALKHKRWKHIRQGDKNEKYK